MHVDIHLLDRRNEPYIKEIALFDFFDIEKISADFVEKSGMCEQCDGTLCHVIGEDGTLYCPILFADITGLFSANRIA